MIEDKFYVIVEAGVLPGIFKKTLEAKRLIESGKCRSVQDAVKEAGISRSAFYKYKDSVFALSNHVKGSNLTMAMNLENNPGLLSTVLHIMASGGVNIISINQTIPINNIAGLTITLETRSSDISEIMEKLQGISGISAIRILANN